MRPRIAVVGSLNLDLVTRCERLPRPGETVTGASFSRFPGGKGANQAVACARLGAEVTMIGAIGDDSFADEALAGLREAGVRLDLQVTDDPTGIAVILVDAAGETEIVVAPGANAALGAVVLPEHDAVLCQLEVPDPAVESRRRRIILRGDVPSPVNPPSGCRFHTRCWLRTQLDNPERCATERPELRTVGGGHQVACHYAEELLEPATRQRRIAAAAAGSSGLASAEAADEAAPVPIEAPVG